MNPNDTDNIREQRRLLAEQIARLDKARERMMTFQRSQAISRVYRTLENGNRLLLRIDQIYQSDDGIIIEVT